MLIPIRQARWEHFNNLSLLITAARAGSRVFRLRNFKDERARYASGLALATANLASASTALLQQTAAGANSIATLGFNVGLQADISAQESTSETKRSTSIGSIIRGDIINLTTGTRTTDGTTTRYNTANTQIDMEGADVEGRVGSTNSTNVGISQGTSRTRTQETVVTSLTSGGTAEITVKVIPT